LFFANLLKRGGVIMICGSLAMQQDVEAILSELLLEKGLKTIAEYKADKQFLTDCY